MCLTAWPLAHSVRASALSPISLRTGDSFTKWFSGFSACRDIATRFQQYAAGTAHHRKVALPRRRHGQGAWQSNNCVAIIDASASRCTSRNVRLIRVTFFKVRL